MNEHLTKLIQKRLAEDERTKQGEREKVQGEGEGGVSNCPTCGGNCYERQNQWFPYCRELCQIYGTQGLLQVLEYARERVVFAPESSTAYDDTIAALNLAIKKIHRSRIFAQIAGTPR